jgi:hypothetical protein
VSDKYALITAEKADPNCCWTLGSMCAWLGVSTSGYHDWRVADPSPRALRRAVVTQHVQAAFDAGRGTYGTRRVHAMLTRSDDPQVACASPKLVRSIMAELGLMACQPRAWRTTTVRDPDAEAVIVDHLGRDFTATAPGTKLVGDITYIRTWTGWLYLATVIDCHTRAVIGWSMATHMRTSLICDAMSMAAGSVDLAEGVVFHSDRGTQGGFNRSSQHLDYKEVFDGSSTTGCRSCRKASDEIAWSPVSAAACGAGVLAPDRRRDGQRGRRGRCRRVSPGRVAVVPQRWRHVTDQSRRAVGPVPVAC